MSELSTTSATTTTSEPNGTLQVDEPTDAGQPCAVCPHPWPAHDHLGMRFCTATVASSSTRGCICR